MIAVTFALPDESDLFLKSICDLRKISGGSLPHYSGTLNGLEITVLHTGVGEASTRARLAAFLSENRPVFLISSGFAGALDPALKIGSLVVSLNYSSRELLEAALIYFKTHPGVYFGGLTTQTIPAESIFSKQSLADQTGALAVDMETSVISAACFEASIPFLSLRAISDTANQPLPVPFAAWFDSKDQKARPSSLLLYLTLHPGVIPDFVRFVRGVFQSKKILASRLGDLIGYLKENRVCSQL
ncbi:MAG: hypothetical protein WCH43_05355 [Verrucomicrobiota bacterium]